MKTTRKIIAGTAALLTGAYLAGDYVGFWGPSFEKSVTLGQTKVACVGDSITYGMTVAGRRWHCYPAVLQRILGAGYHVRNYGANNRNAMESGQHPYTKEQKYRNSMDFLPDIVLIKLGTNDSKKKTWQGKDIWRRDYEKIVRSYMELKSNPKIFLLTPASPQIIKNDGTYGDNMLPEAIAEECDVIRELAAALGLQIIDINSLTAGHPEWFSSDHLHPNREGAAQIAQEAAKHIKNDFEEERKCRSKQ